MSRKQDGIKIYVCMRVSMPVAEYMCVQMGGGGVWGGEGSCTRQVEVDGLHPVILHCAIQKGKNSTGRD